MAMKPESSKAPPSGEQLARTLLFAKLAPPVLRSDVIGRARLLQPIERAVRAKLLLIHAPAGYGKTTLMVQWFSRLKQAGEGVGWINLDERDNDAATLLAELQLAILPASGHEVLDALTLINRCAADHQRFTLFLDELETLQSAQSIQLIELLLDYSPGNLHVVISTRFTPALPVSKWSVRHELLELDGKRLAFAAEEAACFLQRRSPSELSAGALEALLQKTEGWPAALQLAAASLAHTNSAEIILQVLSGSKGQIMEYLAVDVVGKLPQA